MACISIINVSINNTRLNINLVILLLWSGRLIVFQRNYRHLLMRMYENRLDCVHGKDIFVFVVFVVFIVTLDDRTIQSR